MPDLIAFKRREIRATYDAQERDQRPRASIAALRIADLQAFFRDCYRGAELPDDDAGRIDARLMACHLAHRSGDPALRIAAWLADWAPWMSADERDELVVEATTKPTRWRADTLAKKLGLTEATRRRLRITTIGASDCTKAERLERRRKRARLAKQERRRAAGVVPRADYLAALARRPKKMRPWKVAGISRGRWYRSRRLKPPAPQADGVRAAG